MMLPCRLACPLSLKTANMGNPGYRPLLPLFGQTSRQGYGERVKLEVHTEGRVGLSERIPECHRLLLESRLDKEATWKDWP